MHKISTLHYAGQASSTFGLTISWSERCNDDKCKDRCLSLHENWCSKFHFSSLPASEQRFDSVQNFLASKYNLTQCSTWQHTLKNAAHSVAIDSLNKQNNVLISHETPDWDDPKGDWSCVELNLKRFGSILFHHHHQHIAEMVERHAYHCSEFAGNYAE